MPAKLTSEHYYALAAKRGYEWLGAEVINNRTKTLWRCQLGHEWLMPYDNLQQGQSCPTCSREQQHQARRLKPDDYNALAESRGFRWVVSAIKNNRTPTEWECSQGHRWYSTYNSINEGRGCPDCLKQEIHERYLRQLPYKDGLKQCNTCGEHKPPTKESFNSKPSSLDGLTGDCRICHNLRVERVNRAKGIQPKPITRKDGMKRCSACKAWFTEDAEHFVRSSKRPGGFDNRCKFCAAQWRSRNPDYILDYQAAYRADPSNREKARLKTKAWRDADPKRAYDAVLRYHKAHPEVGKRAVAKWTKNHPDNIRAAKQRRRARKNNLPATFTKADWQRAVEYFNGCCAACGRQLNNLLGDQKAHADHWIPLASPNCPGTVPANIVPLCGGKTGCNTSKFKTMPEVWLTKRFGKRDAEKILTRIEAYFEWVKQSGDH